MLECGRGHDATVGWLPPMRARWGRRAASSLAGDFGLVLDDRFAFFVFAEDVSGDFGNFLAAKNRTPGRHAFRQHAFGDQFVDLGRFAAVNPRRVRQIWPDRGLTLAFAPKADEVARR